MMALWAGLQLKTDLKNMLIKHLPHGQEGLWDIRETRHKIHSLEGTNQPWRGAYNKITRLLVKESMKPSQVLVGAKEDPEAEFHGAWPLGRLVNQHSAVSGDL